MLLHVLHTILLNQSKSEVIEPKRPDLFTSQSAWSIRWIIFLV